MGEGPMRRGGAISLGFGVALALTCALSCAAVSPLAAQPRGTVVPRSSPPLSAEDQLAPSQMKQPIPAAASDPPGAPAAAPSHPAPSAAANATAEAPAAAGKQMQPSASRTVIACSGPFAPDSGMLELAMIFGSLNMIYTEEKVQDSQVGVTV